MRGERAPTSMHLEKHAAAVSDLCVLYCTVRVLFFATLRESTRHLQLHRGIRVPSIASPSQQYLHVRKMEKFGKPKKANKYIRARSKTTGVLRKR